MDSCAGCGFDWDQPDSRIMVEQIRKLPVRFHAPLTRFLAGEDPDVVLRARPADGSWSALEYAAHTVDALDFYRGRIDLVLTEDHPQLAACDFAAALAQRGEDEGPGAVAAALTGSSERLADRLDGLDEAAWRRTGIGSTGEDRSVMDLARRAVHEGHHHLLDIGRTLRTARGRS